MIFNEMQPEELIQILLNSFNTPSKKVKINNNNLSVQEKIAVIVGTEIFKSSLKDEFFMKIASCCDENGLDFVGTQIAFQSLLNIANKIEYSELDEKYLQHHLDFVICDEKRFFNAALNRKKLLN